MKTHAAALMLALSVILLAALALAFQPKPHPALALPPLHPGLEDGLAQLGGKTKIDINHADAALLRTLPGIGEALAGRIVAYRQELGPFQSVDQLTCVSGIGQAKLDAIREFVTCEAPAGTPSG